MHGVSPVDMPASGTAILPSCECLVPFHGSTVFVIDDSCDSCHIPARVFVRCFQISQPGSRSNDIDELCSARADCKEICRICQDPETQAVRNGYIGKMRLSIAQKLVLALFGLTLLVLVATLGLARWSFERGFLDYVNALEQTRLERIGRELEQYYVAAGENWATMTSARFDALSRQSAPREPFPGGPRAGEPRPGEPRPNNDGSGRRDPLRSRQPPPPRPEMLEPPTALFDLNEQQIAILRSPNKHITIRGFLLLPWLNLGLS